MGLYNQYPLGVNGMGDWFLSPGQNGNVAHARSFPQHMGGMGVSFGPDSAQINMDGLGESPWTTAHHASDILQDEAIAARVRADGAGGNVFHESHELLPNWAYYAIGGVFLYMILGSGKKKT